MNFQQVLLVVFIVFITKLYLAYKKKTQNTHHEAAKSSSRATKLPPGPKPLPIIGNLHQVMDGTKLHVSLQRLAKEYGPLMYLKMGSTSTLVISSANMARELFKNHDRSISGRPFSFVGNKISYGSNDLTFASYGDYWKESRKICALELLRDRKVQSYQGIRGEELSLMLDAITKRSTEAPVDLSKMAFSLANNVLCRAAFGNKYDCENYDNADSKYYQLLIDIQTMVGEFNIGEFFPWLNWVEKLNGREARIDKICESLNSLYERIVDDYVDRNGKKPEQGGGLVDALMKYHKDENAPIKFERHHVKGNLGAMFIAGTEAASTTIVYAMSELMKNPSTLIKAQEEVRRVVGKRGKVEEADIPNLPYLKCVIKETFRVHVPTPILVPRETTEAFKVLGYDIPAKTTILVNEIAITMDPEVWENPKKFQPERFWDSKIDFRGHDFELLPFGAGRRMCPAVSFADSLIAITVANLIYRFDWKLPGDMKNKDIDTEEAPGLTQKMKNPLVLVPIPWNI